MIPESERLKFVQEIFTAAKTVRVAGRKINPAVCTAQAALETGYGTSGLYRKAKNLFGIKARASWKGRRVGMSTKEYDFGHPAGFMTTAFFRAYDSFADSIRDYADVIEKLSWYADAASVPDDWEKFLAGILPRGNEPGWATDPKYGQKITGIILTFDLDENDKNFPEENKGNPQR